MSLLKTTEELTFTTSLLLGNHEPIPMTLEAGSMEDLPFDLPIIPGRKYKVTIHIEELDYRCPHDKEVDMHYTINCFHCGHELRRKS